MQFSSNEHIRLIEWADYSKHNLVYRFPTNTIHYGDKLSVRESQQAIFVQKGSITDRFNPGLFTLTGECTSAFRNLEVNHEIHHATFGADVYFIKTKYCINQAFISKQPLTIGNSESLPVTISGKFDVRIINPVRLLSQYQLKNDLFTSMQVSDAVAEMITSMLPKVLVQNKESISGTEDVLDQLVDLIQESINIALDAVGLMIRNLSMHLQFLESA
jgi:membrane protease subunit (stomatin/prohibitin family)